jgi:glyoxylase-like metal-dependent hydrolase (beta-lactamase superfamily II)
MVNVYFAGVEGAGDRSWVLIDAGLRGWTGSIVAAAERRFGAGARPSAVVLTHGHFDHVGGLPRLAELWDVPVYAHELELPYLDGRSPYPPPDPSVGGGAMARLSFLYPRGPIDLGARLRPLPADGTVPGMPGWRWVATPGHSPGHVSLFREADRTLVAGDAFVTVKQESALAVIEQRPEIHGPPAYYTCDWLAAKHSVQALAELGPRLAATGHGIPLGGPALSDGLKALAQGFDRVAVPPHGRYTAEPALTDANGVVSLPPAVWDPVPTVAAGFALGIVAGAAIGVAARRRG